MAWTDPRTWAAGETVTAALMNQHLRDNLKALGDPWTAYVPTWTGAVSNPTIGNGTLAGGYIKVGRLVLFRVTVTFGSTTGVGNGSYTWSLPFTAARSFEAIGTCHTRDSSVPSNRGQVVFTTSTTTIGAHTPNDGTRVADAWPFSAWGTGDTIALTGMYEAA